MLLGNGIAQVGLATAVAESPAVEQLELWIEQLNDDRFGVRTRATNKLIEAGAAVVEPVSKLVETGNLEVATRAVYVLQKLAYSEDLEVQERSLQALRAIADSGKPAPARLAREAIVGLGDIRQQRAAKALTRLGASIAHYGPARFAVKRQLEVEIGPDWTGAVKDLKRLVWLRDLRKLTFVGPQVTNAWIASIRELEGVSYLIIKDAQITDDALRDIGEMKTLVYLDLMYTPVTDAGLEHLRAVKSLRMIRCFGTKITREAAERLDAELAQVEVQHKVGAFLGVRCQPPPGTCKVVQVTPGSGAEKAGIKPRDIIVRFDDNPVPSFDDLERLIARNKVGDTVEIEVVRGGRMLARQVSNQRQQPLGIEGKPVPIGIEVKQVKAGGVGAIAGIRAGDWILAVNDQRITSMDQLRKQYEASDPDQSQRWKTLRDTDARTTKVTFGEWNE